MPLKKGKKYYKSNIKELITGKIGTARQKAIRTYAKRKGISLKEARAKLAVKIAKSYVKK